MKTLIIYVSEFGNTEQIAFAIRDAILTAGDVITRKPSEFKQEDLTGVGLLIVGSPTQKFSPLPEVTNLIKLLSQNAIKGKKVAAFDTRVDLKKVNSRFLSFMVWMFGYAAEPIAKRLKAKGGKLIVKAEGFFVEDTKGPLAAGEIERAKDWAKKLGAASSK